MRGAFGLFLLGVLANPVLGANPFPDGIASEEVQFNRDIRPILAENCFSCHGQDPHSRGADLRLDEREAAISSGAIVPNSPDDSAVWARIVSESDDERMPPVDSHKSLTAAQKELIRQWILEGAPYQGHWAFEPPQKPELPQVTASQWVRNPIDNFVLSNLERSGLAPAQEADLRSLIRRVSLDLTGLPPTPEELQRVLDDPSSDRYERYVDELLERPEWGEHRARYWLDYARYADTHGIHFDNYREMWAFRDWVIKAFNENMPFDQFSIEQLAGDLLPDPTLDQKIATGFNRCNITTNEGGVIQEEYRVLYTRDRVETTGLVWMGLTLGCAVCHDHKFDPISQKEFYELAAFFNNTTQPVMDGNIKDTPPIIQVPVGADRERSVEVSKLIEETQGLIAARRAVAQPLFDKYLTEESKSPQVLWSPADIAINPSVHVPLNDGATRWLSVIHEGAYRRTPLTADAKWVPGHVADQAWKIEGNFPSLPVGDFERDQAFSVALWVNPSQNQNGALVARMDEASAHRGWDVWTENGSVGIHIIHRWPENALKVVSQEKLPANRWSHVSVTYDGSSKIEGLKIYIDGKETQRNVTSSNLTESIRTTVPLTIGRRSSGAGANNASVQDIRIYAQSLDPASISKLHQTSRRAYLMAKAVRNAEEVEELFQHYLTHVDDESKRLHEQLSNLKTEESEIRSRSTFAHIMNEAETSPVAYVLLRGDYDKRGDEVSPATPQAFLPLPDELPKNRLGFAKWLFIPEHPLTARVTVNRFWQEVFGRGIVGSAGDFGITGQLPDHPELLDYLAIQFRDNGWNVKDFYRQLVTSATYRQSAAVSPENFAKDPENKLLSRGPRFRTDAEMIRDSALAVSELLVKKMGGPSVYPYQPPGVWEAVAMPGSNTRFYQASTGESLYRRSLYTFLKRAAPMPNMEVFNATSREVCTIRRERTNTPLQALVTLNDVQFVEAARLLATQMLSREGNEEDLQSKIQWIAERLISRPFNSEELRVVEDSFAELLEHYKANAEDANHLLALGETRSAVDVSASELAAWTMLCNQLMNLDEVLTK